MYNEVETYIPKNDEKYEEHMPDDVTGYPYMIDPTTGFEWGIDPANGGSIDGITWPTDSDDGSKLDPMYEEDLTIFGTSPFTGVLFGLNPDTNEPWRCDIFDSNGDVYNSPAAVEDDVDEVDIPSGDVSLEECEDPVNTYRPSSSEECI